MEEMGGSQSSKVPKSIQDYPTEFLGPYKNVCAERPENYSFYNKFDIKWGSLDNYQIVHKLGRGKYSEVFEGCNINNNQRCVLKILKPVRQEKIHRETKILQTLYGGPNIVKLYDCVRDPVSKTPCFVYEFIPSRETKQLIHSFELIDIQLYTYKILEALDFAHSHGIMHRDVKPLNIVINHEERDLRLIDWGLADYYKPD